MQGVSSLGSVKTFKRQTVLALGAITISLLSACGNLPEVNPDTPTPQQQFILTLNVSGSETRQGLEARYGGTVLILDAQNGFAMMRVPNAPQSNDPRVKNVQLDIALTSPELSSTVDPILTPEGNNSGIGGSNSYSSGWSAWSAGWSAWSAGWSAWSAGSTSANPELPSQNTSSWNQVKLFEAHRLSRKFGTGIKVAVVDTGVDTAHPMFAGRLAPSTEWWDFVGNDANPQEVSGGNGYGHGTAVAGIILQVAPRATILPIRVLDRDGSGLTSNVVAGISRAVNMGAQIINVSIGTDGYDQSLFDICSWANQRGVLIIASAGNNGKNNEMTSPGMFTWYTGTNTLTLGIGSVKNDDKRSSFSAYGNNMWAFAPGEQIWSAAPGNQFANFTGTSFAAPIVTGAFALGYSETPNAADRSKLEGAFWSGLDWPTSSKYQGTDGYWKGGRVNLENFIRRLPGWTEPTDVQPGVYTLVNVNSGKCVDVEGAFTHDGANVLQWTCYGGNNQKWQIEKVGSNYKLTVVHSGKALDVQGGVSATQDGANVQQWGYGGPANQLWQITKSGSGFRLVASHSGKCLNVSNSGLSDGTNIQQFTCNGTTAQQFYLRALF